MLARRNSRRIPATSVRILIFSCSSSNGCRYSCARPHLTSPNLVSTWVIRSRYNLIKSYNIIWLKLNHGTAWCLNNFTQWSGVLEKLILRSPSQEILCLREPDWLITVFTRNHHLFYLESDESTLEPYFPKINFILFSYLYPSLQSGLFPSAFTKRLH